MALSPQYGWAEPDNSSLVKNGASDIRTLGDAIDTSVWNVGFGQAGKNKIINGDFTINQRSFTSTTTTSTYGFDRFKGDWSGGVTYSAQTFTAGSAPVAGYEAVNYARLVTSGQTNTNTYSFFYQPIEDVRTFAGQTMTYSFWAKAATGTPKVYLEFDQQFGSGGSTRVLTAGSSVTLSTSWARYSVTFTVPSVSGKTIGTSSYVALNMWFSAGSDFNSRTGSLGIQSNTFDFWGVQAEYGSKATPFQTATKTIQGELAACQRYYFRNTPGTAYGLQVYGASYATNTVLAGVIPPVTMRVTPTSVDVSNLQVFDVVANASYSISSLVFASAVNGPMNIGIEATASGATAGRPMFIRNNNNTAGYLGFSAEL